MAMARIEIEEHGIGQWIAEIEVGGLVARRRRVTAPSFEEVMELIFPNYYEIRPEMRPAPPPVVLPPLVPTAPIRKTRAPQGRRSARPDRPNSRPRA